MVPNEHPKACAKIKKNHLTASLCQPNEQKYSSIVINSVGYKQGTVAQTYNPTTQDVMAGRL